MATLENIRKRGKLIAIVIGLALLAFVIGDLFTSGTKIMSSEKTKLASVNGNKIDIVDFENFVRLTEEYIKIVSGNNQLDENTLWQIRSAVWDIMLREAILEKTIKKHSLNLSKEELKDLTIGEEPHPIITQIFVNPETGQFDRNFLLQVLQQLDKKPKNSQEAEQLEKIRTLWLYIENFVKHDRVYQKYINLLSKSFYVNTLEVKNDYTERKKTYDLEIIGKTIFDIPDDQITFTQKDLKKLYKEKKNLFFTPEDKVSIKYVEFEVKPLKEDSLLAYEKALKIKEQIEKATNAEEIYTEGKKDVTYFSVKDLKAYKLDSLKLEVNKTYGPFFIYNVYNIFKVLSIENLPDTVSAKHILISPNNPAIKTKERAKQLADSLLDVIKKGGNFEQLAQQYSDDPGSKDKGGLYENFTRGQMVPEFENFCFKNKVGEIGIVETKFGYHIVQVTNQKAISQKHKVIHVQLEITPSENTDKYFYAQATKFRAEAQTADVFDSVATKYKLRIKLGYDLNKGSYAIPGIQNAREIVRWAFNTEDPKTNSDIFQIQDKYVVASIIKRYKAGIIPFEDVEKELQITVRLDKKVEKIYNEITAKNLKNDLNEISQALNTPIQNVPAVSFNAFQIYNIGFEPAIFGAIYKSKVNDIIGPIKGKNGVYYIKVLNINEPQPISENEILEQQNRMIKSLRTRASNQIFTTLKYSAKIKDRRTLFF